jgi:hypothetical protein
VLRRFELYALAPDAPGDAVESLATAARRCGRYIPEVRYSAVGHNVSGAPVDLVWEHAFDSPAAYRRYMAHPFHAAVLDRYLLADSPERIVTDDPVGAGLVGYTCAGPEFALPSGVRRLVLLRVDAAAAPDDVDDLCALLRDAPGTAPEMTVSVVAANTLGPAWFDGETLVSAPARWTHLWEQGFATLDALAAYRDGESATARVERDGWPEATGGAVRRAADVAYELELDSSTGE